MPEAGAETTAPADVAASYGLDAIREVHAAPGTAGRAWRIITRSGGYFLRQRGVRTATRARIAFDHALRRHLVRHGVPTVEPLPNRDGQAVTEIGGRIYELYPLVEGRAFRFDSEPDLDAVARGLADFHNAARSYPPPAEARAEQFAQFAWLGFSSRASERLDDPELLVVNLEGLLGSLVSSEHEPAVAWALDRARRLHRDDDAASPNLDTWIVHGDYKPTNLLMGAGDEVAGIFDFDWAARGSRCRDLADALYFFARNREPPRPEDVWQLAVSARFDVVRCQRFLRTYHAAAPLTREELDHVPAAFERRWLAVRLEGMAKVPDDQRLTFFDRSDIRTPVESLAQVWPTITRAIASTG